MSAAFDLFVRRNTWVYRLDPRVKFAFVVVASAVTFLLQPFSGPLLVCGLSLLLLRAAAVPLARTVRLLRALAPLLVLALILTALFSGGPTAAWFRWGPVGLSFSGVLNGTRVTLRLLALSLAFFVWLSVTDQSEMARGFIALGLPADWGFTLALALRYLPLLSRQFEQVREAQAARGLDLAAGGFASRLRRYQPVLIAVVIEALRQSERLGWALESRAFGAPGVRRTVYRPLHLRTFDYWAFIALALFLVVSIATRLF